MYISVEIIVACLNLGACAQFISGIIVDKCSSKVVSLFILVTGSIPLAIMVIIANQQQKNFSSLMSSEPAVSNDITQYHCALFSILLFFAGNQSLVQILKGDVC